MVDGQSDVRPLFARRGRTLLVVGPPAAKLTPLAFAIE